jgi:phosphoribosylformylglycinamidine cyclo-ligase
MSDDADPGPEAGGDGTGDGGRDGNRDGEGDGERGEGVDEAGDGETERAGMTYTDAGVDVAESEAAVEALAGAVSGLADTTEYAGLVDIGDRYLGLTTDGVGTKVLVAAALDDYSTIGIDCVAMNVNDLVAAGVAPVAFVDYLALDDPDEDLTAEIGEGLARAADEAGVALVGGETAVLPEVVDGFDLAGTCAGLATEADLLPGEATAGDALVGFPSSGIHSNGLTLARQAATTDHEYADPFPGEGSDSVGEALLEPTRLYTYLLGELRARETHAAAHVTGGGWTNLSRMGEYRYEVTDPFDAQPVFEFVREAGNVDDEEMHRTFNMGTGFVAALPESEAESLADATDGRVIGRVAEGGNEGEGVAVRGLEL